ncbi:MAG: ABC transporter permease [Bdellovibrionia bacterium]
MESNSKQILGADLSVSARREFKPEETAVLNAIPAQGNAIVYDFFAMASSQKQSRLVLVKAIDANYPLYGEFTNSENKKILAKDFANKNEIWIYPEVKEYFQINIGEPLKLGNLEFTVKEIIGKDSTLTFRSASLAPRVYIPADRLGETGLIQFGSTFTKSYFFSFKDEKDTEKIKEEIFSRIKDPAVRVDTPKTASEDSGRQLNYLSDYLGLVTLVALFLSAIGASYLFRLFLQQKIKDIAIFRSLGLKANQAVNIFLIETFVLGLGAVVFASLFSVVIFPLLTSTLKQFLPFPIQLIFTAEIFITSFLIATLGSLSISLPFISRLKEISVSQLFSEDHFQSEIRAPKFLSVVPAFVLFIVLSIYQANSIKVGLGFTLGLGLGILFLAMVGLAFFYGFSKLPLKRWYRKYSLISLQRRKVASLALFVSLALGSLLINILPQIKTTLQQSLQAEERSKLPSLFMFDIQDEQYEPLKTYFNEKNLNVLNFSPMVRGRILKINGNDYERVLSTQEFKTREEEQEVRFRNRGVNITYRSGIGNGETLVEGRDFNQDVNPDLAQITVEKRYAGRLGLNVGDTLVFDVQGLEISAKIVGLRDVKWASFQPNFFIVMQPGFLEEAPKTFIAALPYLQKDLKMNLQKDLAQQFSNISIIDVERLVEDVLKLAEQMSLSLELMAWLSLFAGYVVLFSVVRTQVSSRRWELNMLKILGAKPYQLKSYLLLEILVVAFAAGLLGAGFSFVASSILSYYLFESKLVVNLWWPTLSLTGICLMSLVIGYLASIGVIKEKPQKILLGD